VTGVQGEVPSDGGRDGGELRVEASKYDVGSLPPKVDAGELPWGYGENRITAIVRDPESAYVYWEITDDGIASARSRLGAAGADATSTGPTRATTSTSASSAATASTS
jgi:hypothetical protein